MGVDGIGYSGSPLARNTRYARIPTSPRKERGEVKGRRRSSARFNLLEPHALAVGEPCGDVAAFEAGFALRHFFLRTAQGFPPRGAVRRARQRRVDDLFDRSEAQHEFRGGLLLQVIAQRFVVVHGHSWLWHDGWHSTDPGNASLTD